MKDSKYTFTKSSKRSRGQSLLIVLMLAALISTIVGTAAFRSAVQTSNTNTNTQQQIAQKGAQGLLEKILNNEDVDINQDLGVDLNTSINPLTKKDVVSFTFSAENLIAKDTQYMYYLSSYDPKTNTYGATSFTGTLAVYFDSENNCPVLELTYIGFTAGGVPEVKKREATSTCGTNTVGVSSPALGSGKTVAGVTYGKSWSIDLSAVPRNSAKMLVIRPLFGATKLHFESASTLPTQGQNITVIVQTSQGTQQEEQVYRPYPQINDLPIFLSIF